jgi:hypothetical protein
MRPNHITSSVFTNGSLQYPPGPYPNEKQNPNYVKKLEIASAVFDPEAQTRREPSINSGPEPFGSELKAELLVEGGFE